VADVVTGLPAWWGPHPVTRAATLLHTPHVLSLRVSEAGEQLVAVAAATGPRSMALLVAPGPLATAVRARRVIVPCTVTAPVQVAGPDEQRARIGSLRVAGHAQPVEPGLRRQAAVRLCDTSPTPELLDAMSDDGWLLVDLALEAVELKLPSGTHRLRPERVCQTRLDQVLRRSASMCAQLNAEDPELVERLAGRPGWLVEMDARGVSAEHPISIGDGAGARHTRLDWPTTCNSLEELTASLLGLTVQWTGQPAAEPAERTERAAG
jgi:hypothetical protein